MAEMDPGTAMQGFVAELVEEGVVSSAAALVGFGRSMVTVALAGERAGGGNVGSATRFDLASLTKPAVATLALVLHQRGELSLELPLGEVWPDAPAAAAAVPLEDLLRHRAGLQPWAPLYGLCSKPDEALEQLAESRWWGAAPGTYSDLGYILWGKLAERLLARPLPRLLDDRLSGSLGLVTFDANPGPGMDVAACFLDSAKEVELASALDLPVDLRPAPAAGTVQDGNAHFLGGLAGHAGLFGGLLDVWRLGREWLQPGALLAPQMVAAALAGDGPFALGWARRGDDNPGAPLSASAFGHSGFTGTSLWIDPDRQRILVFLAHRTSPSRTSTATGTDSTSWSAASCRRYGRRFCERRRAAGLGDPAAGR